MAEMRLFPGYTLPSQATLAVMAGYPLRLEYFLELHGWKIMDNVFKGLAKQNNVLVK